MEDFNSLAPQSEDSTTQEPFFTARPSDQSVLDRMIAIFTAPKEAMEGIEHSSSVATWIVPLIVALLLTSFSAGIRYMTTPAAQDEHTARVIQFEKMANNKNYPAEQRKAFHDNAMKDTSDPSKAATTGVIAVFATLLLSTMISGLFFWLAAKFVFRSGELRFSTVLIASSLTMMIGALGDLIGVVLQSVLNNGSITVSPGVFFPGTPTDPIFMLASQFNLFKIWELVVFAIGFGSLIRRSTGTASIVVFGSWLLRVGIWTGLLFLFQKMAG